MQIGRRAFLRTGGILPAAALAELLAEHVEAEERGGGDDERSAAETSGFATVNGQKLYYVTLGRGTPVIFMHGGLGFDHQYFRPFVDPLADSAEVVYYDQLGHGKSDRPANFNDITLARLSAGCDGLATALGLDKFVLVGHSDGGCTCPPLALR